MLIIPQQSIAGWAREIVDDCMGSASDRGQIYARATKYFYLGSPSSEAAIHNKCGPFIGRLSGYLYSPLDVRFSIVFTSDDLELQERASRAAAELNREYRTADVDLSFAEAVTWDLILGCYFLKHKPSGKGFAADLVHPLNMGVLSESTIDLADQEAFCHISYPTLTELNSLLDDHPRQKEIMQRVLAEASREPEPDEPATYLHQMIVGGLQPLGSYSGGNPSAAGVVNVFPVPQPWRAERKSRQTTKLAELWVSDGKGDYVTIQLLYPDIVIEGEYSRRNLSRIPGKSPFVKVQGRRTPGYFWGRSTIADVQMLQDVLNRRLRDIKVMWDRNTRAPKVMSGFTSITEEIYDKIISEGGFISDPNPGAKAQNLAEPPPQGYLEELQLIWKMFDEVAGFTPVLSGQGESGVRAGVHAETLVRTSSSRLILQAGRIERQLADSGYLGYRMMQANDATIYTTETGKQFLLKQMPDDFQVEVDSHSASPAFREDARENAVLLARAGAMDAEDFIHALHPPRADLLVAKLKHRQSAAPPPAPAPPHRK